MKMENLLFWVKGRDRVNFHSDWRTSKRLLINLLAEPDQSWADRMEIIDVLCKLRENYRDHLREMEILFPNKTCEETVEARRND